MLMLLADARLPVAGHTQSGTLESALVHGLPVGDVPVFVRTRLETITLVEAGTAVVARRVAASGGGAAALAEVEDAWAARTPSAALRDAVRAQGRAVLRLARHLWPDAREIEAAGSLPTAARGVVLGAIAAHTALGPDRLARLIGYDDVQTVCAAALKLAPLDPTEVTRWVHAAMPTVERLAERVAGITAPAEIPAAGCPQIEAWAQAHALSTRRLFRA